MNEIQWKILVKFMKFVTKSLFWNDLYDKDFETDYRQLMEDIEKWL